MFVRSAEAFKGQLKILIAVTLNANGQLDTALNHQVSSCCPACLGGVLHLSRGAHLISEVHKGGAVHVKGL